MPPPPPYDRTLALACQVRTFGKNWLELWCCSGTTMVPLRGIADDRAGHSLADVVVRLRCKACGRPPASVVLAQSPQRVPDAYGGRQGWRLVLIERDD